ncbi:glutamate receptor ionotropic, kainate 2-like isoform X3 [Lineus longissimus]|uniref:glutamate receptor ionotropic, kainate 2-like isoform X3 n=1 Tax=Lineus longissimus TaxID=88925 RepID=UPI002B4C5819
MVSFARTTSFVLFYHYFLMFFVGAVEKLKVGIIDYPDGRWRQLAREVALIKDLPFDVKDMALTPPVSIKHALEVERFVKSENISVLIGRNLHLITVMSTELSVPYLITEENHLLGDISLVEQPEMVLTMFPGPDTIKQLIADLIVYFRMEDICLIYDTETGHSLIGHILSKNAIFIRSLQLNVLKTDADLMAAMIGFRSTGKTNIMVLVHPSNIPRMMNMAMQLSLLVPVYHWIIVTLDARVIDFKPWTDSGMNVTMFQLSHEETNGRTMPLQDSLLVDALSVVDHTVQNIRRRENRTVAGLKDAIEKANVIGWTGPIEFDEKGFRKNLILDIMGLNEKGRYKKGNWIESGANVTDRVKIHEPPFNDLLYDDEAWPLGRETVRVVSIANASMSVSPLIISTEREAVVDFTKPFKQCDMNVLIARPDKKYNLLQFLTPLHWTVWILMAVAVIVLSIVLTMIDKFNPNDEFDAEQPRFSYSESLWFFSASLVQAGTESTPQVLSARILSSFWWFFSLIIISSYTANMAAFLTMSQISTPINGVLSLGDQNEVRYGTATGSRTADFFHRSSRETFRNMWLAMSAGNMVENTAVAVQKVVKGDYAFIWDAPVNDFIATQNCRTMAVGGPFQQQGYGIGLPMGATYRDVLTIAILKLNENGILQKLDEKYWGASKCALLEDAATNTDTAELEIQNVGGIFIILSCGILISLVVCGLTYCWRKRKEKLTNIHPKGITIEDKWNELQERRLGGKSL